MKNHAIASVIVILAILLRFLYLGERPMHTDEAVNAFKQAELLEQGIYIYDKNEYHGPTLNFFGVLPAWINSQTTLASLDENTVRCVPAIAGVGLILVMFLLAGHLGWAVVLIISFLIAISPALVFYSRYFIHEILLILFNAGLIITLFRYFLSAKVIWVLLAGLFTGLMISTKETWVLLIFSQIVAFTIVSYRRGPFFSFMKKFKLRHLVLFLVITLMVAVLLFSSFFQNPDGIGDSVLTYLNYFNRASGEAVHEYPWHYYFSTLLFNSCNYFFFRADIWLLAAALSGMVYIFLSPVPIKNRSMVMFVAITAIVSAVIYSAIPYKTPWNMLSFYAPMVFIAGWFICTVYERIKSRGLRIVFIAISTVCTMHLTWQVYSDNFVFHDQPCNSFVYSHPGEEVLEIGELVAKVAATAPEGNNMYVEIIVAEYGYWPLPWYLRTFPNTGWWRQVDFMTPAAPLIICDQINRHQLTKKLFEIPAPGERYIYIPLGNGEFSLRPGTSVSIYLRKDYWDRYQRAKSL